MTKDKLSLSLMCAGTLFCSTAMGGAFSPITITDAVIDTYVFSQVGPWNTPICEESSSDTFVLTDWLDGIAASANCYPSQGIAAASVSTGLYVYDTQFIVNFFTSGLAEADKFSAFSRQDLDASCTFVLSEAQRLKLDWSLHASGLGFISVALQQAGEPTVFEKTLSVYIEPQWDDGTTLLVLPAGEWHLQLYSTNQMMSTTEGFEQGVTDLGMIATVVAMGDVDGNGVVNTADILAVIGAWGICDACDEDVNGDGFVGVADLLQVIEDWG